MRSGHTPKPLNLILRLAVSVNVPVDGRRPDWPRLVAMKFAEMEKRIAALEAGKLDASAVTPFMLTVLDDVDLATAQATLGI